MRTTTYIIYGSDVSGDPITIKISGQKSTGKISVSKSDPLIRESRLSRLIGLVDEAYVPSIPLDRTFDLFGDGGTLFKNICDLLYSKHHNTVIDMLGHLLPGIHTKLSKFGTATRVAVSVNNDPSYRSEHLICQLMQDYAALDVAVRTRIQVAIRQNYSLQLSVLTETPTDALVNQIIYRAVMDRIMVWHNPQIVIIPVAEKDRMKRMEFKVDLPGQDTGVNFEKCLYESCDTPPGIIENDGIWCYAVTLIALIITAKVPSTQMLMVDKDLDDPQLSRFVHILRVFYRYIYNQGATVREKSLIAHLLQMPAFEEFNSRDAKDVIDFANTFLDIYIALCVEIDCKFASIEMDYVCDRLQASLREHTDADIIYVVIPFDRTFITDVAKQHIILENTTHYLHGAVLYNGHGSIGHYTSFVISDRRIYMYENHNNLRELSSQTPYEKYMARILIYVKKLRPQQLK